MFTEILRLLQDGFEAKLPNVLHLCKVVLFLCRSVLASKTLLPKLHIVHALPFGDFCVVFLGVAFVLLTF